MSLFRNGFFVTIEGIDGSGKTTVVEALGDRFDALTTSEPTNTIIGNTLRQSLASDDKEDLTDLLLFAADRNEHTKNVIDPALKDNHMVICDRYMDSTMAYQHAAHAAPWGFIDDINRRVSRRPDLTIVIDVPPEIALGRSEEEEKYEKLEFLQEVRGNYHTIKEDEGADSNRIVMIDGDQPIECLVHDCRAVIAGRLIENKIEYDEYSD